MTSLKPKTTQPTASRFTSARQPASHLGIMVVGDVNVGKTRICGEAALDPRIQRVLVVNFEKDGTRSLRHIPEEKLDVFNVNNFTNDIIWLREYLFGIYRRNKPTHDGGPKPDVIVFDSVHQAARMAMEELKVARITREYEEWVSKGSRGIQPIQAKDVVGIKAEWPDYLATKDAILPLLIKFAGLPTHLFCTCNDTLGEEDAEHDIPAGHRPDLQRSLAGSVAGLFTKVMWMTFKNKKGSDGKYVPTRTLLVRPQGNYLMVKDRGDDFPVESIDNPNMSQVLDYLLPTVTQERNEP